MNESDRDAAVIARIAEDPTDFDSIYHLTHRHKTAMAGVIFSLLSRRGLADDIEDIMQDVLLEVPKVASKFDPCRADGATWLLMICARVALAHCRRSARRARLLQEKHPVVQLGSTGNEEEQGRVEEIDRDRVKDEVRVVLELLMEDERRLCELYIMEGKTDEETAVELGITRAAVRTRWFRLVPRLREMLAQIEALR